MTLPLSKEQIAAIQARAEKAKKHSMFIAEYRSSIDEHINALCQQALRAIELEASRDSWRRVAERLQTELTAARNALEEEPAKLKEQKAAHAKMLRDEAGKGELPHSSKCVCEDCGCRNSSSSPLVSYSDVGSMLRRLADKIEGGE